MTINECKKWYRSPWRRHVSLDAAVASMPQKQEHKDLVRSVLALPKKYRLPIYLYYYEAYSKAEIAEILKIPKGTVCTYLSRGRELLKMEFREDEDDE